MLGFDPISSRPISDIGITPNVITGYISTTDENDTAVLTGAGVDAGYINTTDTNDTANLQGTVTTVTITGSINTTDENDTANIVGTAGSAQGVGGDGWTKQELERYKRLEQKIAKRQRDLMEAQKQEAIDRKQSIRALVDPSSVAKVKKTELQSKQEVKADIPLAETENLERSIRYLENQRNNILQSVAYRQEMARIQMNLAILEAQRLAEQDDEDSILALLL
mgnify:CR=1 FL=1